MADRFLREIRDMHQAKRMRISTDLPTPTHDAVNAGTERYRCREL